jgi:putative phosphoribosyl transferase
MARIVRGRIDGPAREPHHLARSVGDCFRGRESCMTDATLTLRDRATAGRLLADRLAAMNLADPVVLALPRGGVPVALEIAQRLKAPLDLLMVRKLGVPWQPELAAAAMVDGDPPDIVCNEDVMRATGLDRSEIDRLAVEERKEIERRRALYLAGRPPVGVADRTAILVDDGIATGASVRAALAALARRSAKRLILAVPVAPAETLATLRPQVDEIVCLATPEPFWAIGAHYLDFHQLSDGEVIRLLAQAPSTCAP